MPFWTGPKTDPGSELAGLSLYTGRPSSSGDFLESGSFVMDENASSKPNGSLCKERMS